MLLYCKTSGVLHIEEKVMLLYYDDRNIVRAASDRPILTNVYKCVDIELKLGLNPIGKRLVFGSGKGMRLAVICNWGDACGIATYTKYLVDALAPKVDSLKIFAEDTPGKKCASEYNVDYCWTRGQSMASTIRYVLAWKPTIVLIQHEFGIFPKATHLLQMLHMLEYTPYVVTLHSVYEHLDKTVCSGAMRNIVVHTDTGRDCLRRLGHLKQDIKVIPHGCVSFPRVEENWNITQTPYAIMQFGFGFKYKGVEGAMEAIHLLKKRQPKKYADIHYCYLCSESPHVRNVINAYYDDLIAKVEWLGLQDNVAIIRGFQSDDILNQYLRTYKLAIFPYVTDPANVVYGASGAIRIAMANRIPTIASRSHMFDDMDGVLPRPRDPEELAAHIDEVFSNHHYRNALISNAEKYVAENTWEITADRYLDFLRGKIDSDLEDTIVV